MELETGCRKGRFVRDEMFAVVGYAEYTVL